MKKQKSGHIFSQILAGVLYAFSLFPLSILYVFTDISGWILYRVIKYRRDIVMQNLKNSFPEKTEDELRNIEKKFYRHFSDLMAETIKLKSITFSNLKSRCLYDPEAVALLKKYYDQGRSVMVVMGHCGNWEWAGACFPLYNPYQVITAYRPLKDKVIDKATLKMRSRTGNILATMKNLTREMIKNRNKIIATALIADQTPPADNAFWVEFLHQDTPFFKGTEILSSRFKLPLIWGSVKRVSKGYYKINLELITDKPEEIKQEGEITQMFARFLERDIQDQPESWLWSHRRWKHKKKSTKIRAAEEAFSG
jgi:Kdo2-lipid IVA lauroyltransferase/acyltransferase